MNTSPLYQEMRARLEEAIQFLPDKPGENLDNTLHALWHKAMGSAVSAELAMTKPLEVPDAAQEAALRELVRRRTAGVPLSHLTERQQFMGLEMLAGPEALVPRAETELLARTAVELARGASGPASPTVIDACTGCGNVALAIAHALPNAKVYASDLSEPAVDLARRNAQFLGLADRVDLRVSDVLAQFDTPEFLRNVDLLTCNPPYISSAKVSEMPEEISDYEPALAFDGGPFGVSILMRLLQDAPRILRTGGWLAFEVGLGQGPVLVKRLQNNAAFDEVRPCHDAAGAIRAIATRRA